MRKKKLERSIVVRFQREGIHAYPEAAINPMLADVSFLAFPHRHVFHFEVGIDVFHDNRDIEFIQFKRELEGLFDNKVLQLNNQSCEMIAESIIDTLEVRYPNRFIWVEVFEDGENGAMVLYNPGAQ